jgi:hypothetical protein
MLIIDNFPTIPKGAMKGPIVWEGWGVVINKTKLYFNL